ncbi:pirin family protein [bacterium]|nr:pirin family protein [bacterium]
MIKIYRKDKLGNADHGWLKSRFHFSFADYYDPKRIHFGNLRVINDDLIAPDTGFDMHPHQDMEIISYVVSGELTHQDSMDNKRAVKRGQVQYMSAGKGVMHSEHNFGSEITRLLQIWIFPNQHDLTPNYGDESYNWDDRINKLMPIVSSQAGTAQVKIQQDANIFVSYLESKKEISFKLEDNRQVYFVQIEGSSIINYLNLYEGDGAEIEDEDMTITAKGNSHFMLIELAK